MLNRRFLREKTLQNLYAYYQSGAEDARFAERNLVLGSQKLYELYIHMASIVVELSDFAGRRIEEGKQKYLPSDSDKHPNMRFVQNQFIEQLRNSSIWIKKCADYKISWHTRQELFRNLYNVMQNSLSYKNYMEAADSSYELDKSFVCGFFKRKIANNSDFYHYFEECSMIWAADFEDVAFWFQKSMKNAEKDTEILLQEEEFIVPEDLDFAKELFARTVLHSKEYSPIIDQYLTNWELDRTPLVDVLIIKMAMVEMFHFPSIPVKVTLNEYIEIVKHFSAENSRIFINGLLNRLSEDFVKDGKIKKSGRGLI